MAVIPQVEWQKVSWILQKFIKEEMVGIDFGCGKYKIPNSIGVDRKGGDHVDILSDVGEVNRPGRPFCDYVFYSRLLEEFLWENIISLASDWIQYFLKDNGLFIALVPHSG